MKGKQLAIVLLFLLALGGAALLLNRRNAASWSNRASVSTTKLLNFELNDVAHLTIKSGDAEVNLAKAGDVWTERERADYPAEFTKISALVRKLWELRPVQDVKVGASQLGRLQLGEPNGDATGSILIEMKGAGDKLLAALLLGKTYLKESNQLPGATGGFPAGRYVMAQDGSKRVFLVSETFDEAQTKAESWLSRDFIKVENPKLIAVAGTTPAMNWTVMRENASAPWKLAGAKPGEEFDPAKVSALATLFANATFTDVLPPDRPAAETGLDHPATVRIETFDDVVYELRIGKATGESYPVLISIQANLPKERTAAADEKPEDKAKLDQEFQARQKQLSEKIEKEEKLPPRPYLIARSTIDQLLKERSALLAEKKPAAGPPASPTAAKQSPPTPTPRPRAK